MSRLLFKQNIEKSKCESGVSCTHCYVKYNTETKVGLNYCVRPLSLFYSDASADGVEERSLVLRSRSHARLRRNATLSHAFSWIQESAGPFFFKFPNVLTEAPKSQNLRETKLAKTISFFTQTKLVLPKAEPAALGATKNEARNGEKPRAAGAPRPTNLASTPTSAQSAVFSIIRAYDGAR
ncbi:hypothetical protein EVAR_723_1 [Eumeta japonica]|uniref:Uncharacterized protein n=1 Tax=Eumeta variegata TaxID=151549 RepID=A0A4C1SBZ8_EUMVA|nr:hypothetical protein EVAR_723_1 [Eumeta japonica]